MFLPPEPLMELEVLKSLLMFKAINVRFGEENRHQDSEWDIYLGEQIRKAGSVQ